MQLPSFKRYPRQVRVRRAVYEIRMVKRIPGYKCNILGLCDTSERVIYIRNDLSRKNLLKTFIHEILHAIEEEYNLRIAHSLIHSLETPIFNFLKGNF